MIDAKSVACQRCGARILWALTTANKRMPIDLGPDESGNVYVWMGMDNRLHCMVASKANPQPPGEPHVPHWATCANPPERRRKP